MVQFPDLPFELQTDIWTLVLPSRGGVHWIEFEGLPQALEVIRQSLTWNQVLFNDIEPSSRAHRNIQSSNADYQKYCVGLEKSSLFFRDLYATIPSVFGKTSKLQEGELSKAHLDEIATTQRCRQLSTYSQVATLLQICRTSRLAALEYRRRMISDGAWPLYRSGGAMCRTRPLQVWRQQYGVDGSVNIIVEEPERVLPTICGALDLVVYRFHTRYGHPKEILKHASYQMQPYHDITVIPWFNRIGIEWHPSWATTDGRKNLDSEGFGHVQLLASNLSVATTHLYWLVDGIPRQKWDEYPAAISTAFNYVIENNKKSILRYWQIDKSRKDQLLQHHNLNQEFEANGRRYYVVFVVSCWIYDDNLKESLRDPNICWDGPFPGGENLWPEALRDPVRVAYEIQQGLNFNMWTHQSCSYVLSWEPM